MTPHSMASFLQNGIILQITVSSCMHLKTSLHCLAYLMWCQYYINNFNVLIRKIRKRFYVQYTQFISKYFQSTLGPICGVKPLDTEGDKCETQGYSQGERSETRNSNMWVWALPSERVSFTTGTESTVSSNMSFFSKDKVTVVLTEGMIFCHVGRIITCYDVVWLWLT